MSVQKTHIFLVPGLAASPKIYEYLNFPEEDFQIHFLEWLLPLSNSETIEAYAKRMANLVTENGAVLIGVSFGGIMVQEMSKHLNPKKVIIISSVKCRDELPKRLKIVQKTWAYKLFPSSIFTNIEDFTAFAFGDFVKRRIELYKTYFSVRDKAYLEWAIYNVLHWKNTTPLKNVLHIHGTDDQVFPIKHIKNCVQIERGTHIMILNKAKSISKIIQGAI